MELLAQVIIALITTSLGSVLTYFKAVKDSNTKIETMKINAEKEIQKIREESQKELDRIKTESEENIKTKLIESELELKNKEENLKYDAIGPFLKEMLKEPKKSVEILKSLQDIQKMFSNNK